MAPKNWMRLLNPGAALVTSLVGFYVYSPEGSLHSLIHLVATAMFFGTTVFQTNFVGLILFAVLPPDFFAKAQAQLFPAYFTIQSICGSIMALSLVIAGNVDRLQMGMLVVATIMCILQKVWLTPIIEFHLRDYQKVRKEQGDDSKTPEFKKAKGTFFKWHGISSLMNMFVGVAITFHVFYLSTLIKLN